MLGLEFSITRVRSVKTLLAGYVRLGVFNNSRENKQCRLEKIPDQNNAGEILSRIVRRARNRFGFIAYGVEYPKGHFITGVKNYCAN